MQDARVLYQTIIDTSQEGIWLVDADARTTYVNGRMAEMLGYAVDEMLGRPVYDFMDAAARPEAARNFERTRAGARCRHDLRLRHRGGAEVWAIMSTSPMLGEGGDFRGALAMFMDVTERKRAEGRLRERETLLAAAQRLARLGSWDWDIGANRVVRSDELYRIYGVRPHEVDSTFGAFLHLIHPDDRDSVLGVIENALRERKRFSCEFRIARPDGHARMVHSQGEVICGEGGTPVRVIGVAQDITERKRAEIYNSALASLGHRLSSAITQEEAARIIAQVADDLLGWDACSLDLFSPDLNMVNAILTVDIIDGRRVDVPPTYLAPVPSPMARRVAAEGAQLILRQDPSAPSADLVPFGETSRRSASLMFVPIRDGRKVIGVLSIQSYAANFYNPEDLRTLQALADHCGGALERIQAEQALRENRELFRSAFDYAAIGMALVSPDGLWLQVNPSLCEITGYSEQELLATNFQAVTHPEDLAADLEYVRRMLAGEIHSYQMEKRYIHKLGHLVWILLSVSLVRDAQGGPRYFVSQVQDITARKQAEEQLRISHEQLRGLSAHLQSVREEESARISREIHDELGQLLTGLFIDLSWLEDKLSASGDAASSGPLLAKVGSMVELVDLTIDTVRRIATELKPGLLDDFGLAAAVEWYAQDFQERTGIKCQFASSLDGAELPKEYSTHLFRIFQEALTNIARHANATRADVTLEERGAALALEVRDDGRGISDGELSGFRSLGIIGMRERVRLLGGTIDIVGVRGEGTTVAVSIPLPRPH